MKILFWSLILFIVSFTIHLIAWKIHMPKRQLKTLGQIMFASFFINLFLLWLNRSSFVLFNVIPPSTAIEYIHISLTFTSVAFFYFLNYVALEVDSPSIIIVSAILETKNHGLKPSRLSETLTDEILVKPRVQDLITDKMAFKKGDRYYLTQKGVLLSKLFLHYRNFFNLPKGG